MSYRKAPVTYDDPEYFLVSLNGNAERAYTEKQRLVLNLNADLDALSKGLEDLTFQVKWSDEQMTAFAKMLGA